MSMPLSRSISHLLRALLIACLVALPACASLRPRSAIVLWHALDGDRERALLRLIDRWNQSNPDDSVIVPERRTEAAQHRALLDGEATGRLPDFALVTPAQAAVYDQRGLLTQLDGLVNSANPAVGWDAGDRADLFPFMLQAGRSPQGRLVGVPQGGDARMVLGNRDWSTTLASPELPTTWEAFNRLCNLATDRLAGTLCFGVNPNDYLFEEWSLAHGAPLYTPESNAVQLNAPATVAAIEKLVTDLQIGRAYRAPSSDRSADDFAAARVLFALDWVSRIPDYVTAIRNGGNFVFDTGTLPSPSDAANPAAVWRGPLWVLFKTSPDRERLAWRFVRWLTDTEQSAQWAAATGQLPARASAANALNLDPASARDAARLAVLLRIAPYAAPPPLLSGWPCVQDEMATGLRQIFEGQPITETLTAVQSRAQAVLNEDCSTR
jgi:ABC-type glycerol-3-phosphate transport system substrate-binding protein